MNTSSTSSDRNALEAKPTQSECAECEAGLRRVLAYICEKRYRRLIAFAAVFLLIYSVVGIPLSILTSLASGILIGFIHSRNASIGADMFGLIIALTNFMPSLIVTILIFMRLRKIYKTARTE